MGEISKSRLEEEKDKSAHKKLLVVAGVIAGLVLLLVIVGWYWFAHGKNQAVAQGCSSTAKDSILNQAVDAIENGQTLKPVADQITQVKNFQNDPNCVYILAGYYSQANDANNTQKYVQLLHKFPSNNQPSVILVKSDNKNLQTLKSNIDFLVKSSTQAVSNFVGTGTPQK